MIEVDLEDIEISTRTNRKGEKILEIYSPKAVNQDLRKAAINVLRECVDTIAHLTHESDPKSDWMQDPTIKTACYMIKLLEDYDAPNNNKGSRKTRI